MDMFLHRLSVSFGLLNEPSQRIEPRGTTGTLLMNIFEGEPAEINHPKLIRRYLQSKDRKPTDDYGEYRLAMLTYIKEMVQQK
jgi:hypothetical protein